MLPHPFPQDETEREKIEAEMAANPDTVRILDQLRATRTSAKERQNAMERNIRWVESQQKSVE